MQATQSVGKTLPAGSIAQVWMPTRLVNNVTHGMADFVKQGATVVRSSGYYFNSGFSTGGNVILWEDILNSDPMPPGLNPEEQTRVLGGEACMWCVFSCS